jgi:hypothetical protein
MSTTNCKHKHHDVIVAWAGGAQVQYKYPWEETWHDIAEPSWKESIEYRIKPEDYTLVGMVELYSDQLKHRPCNMQSQWVKDCRVTFDGETHELKRVEVIPCAPR